MKLLLVLALASTFCLGPVYGNSSLRHKIKQGVIQLTSPIVSKIQQRVGAGLLAITISCTLASCGTGILGEDYDRGDHIYFVRDGVAYSGIVSHELDNDLYVIRNVNGTNMETTVAIDAIKGEYAKGSKLMGKSVVLQGVADGVKYRHGNIRVVYDNDYVEIKITHQTMYNDDLIKLAEPYRVFVDRDASLQEGGFVIGDYF